MRVSIVGEVESVNEADARDLLDVNFWGAVRVTKEAVRFFREVNQPVGGGLLQVSSGVLEGRAAGGFYVASFVWSYVDPGITLTWMLWKQKVW